MSRCRACIFDLDGTLMKTQESIAKAVNRTLSDFGLKEMPVVNFNFYAGDGLDKALERALRDAGDPEAEHLQEGIPICRGYFAEDPLYLVEPYPHMAETLRILKKNGIFTAVLNIFYSRTGTPLLEWKFIHIYSGGLQTALFMVVRIMLLISGTFLLTYTTSPIALTDALESLLSPLKKLKVPVHELSMMMCIALRFIPTLIEETDKIISAQKARGADFETGSLIHRAKALIPILVPLFVSAFRRADELSVAMECRCYHGGEGRTRMKVLRFGKLDFLAFFFGALLLALVIVLRVFGL